MCSVAFSDSTTIWRNINPVSGLEGGEEKKVASKTQINHCCPTFRNLTLLSVHSNLLFIVKYNIVG